MIELIPFFAIFSWVGYTLYRASVFDYKTRKIPIKTWNFVVYMILPVSIGLIGLKIWDGVIDVNNPLQALYLSIAMIFLLLIGVLSWYSGKYKNIGIGGADFIAIAIVIITSTALDIYLPFAFILCFIIYSIITIILTATKKDFRIPLLIPISLAYFTAIGFYVYNGFSAFFII